MTDGRQFDFEFTFGIDGAWARLLYGREGYLLTEAYCESPETRQYRVKDYWNWHRNFEVFREQFQADVERFESWLASSAVIEKEQLLGTYYEDQRGGEDELVPG